MTAVPRIVFLDRASIEANIRRPAFEHDWQEYSATTVDQAVERLAGATVAIVNKVPLRAEALDALPQLRMVAVCATGTDNVDLEHCRAHGIAVANIRGYARHAVPEHAMMLMLALSRSVVGYREDLEAGRWQQSEQFCLFTHPIRDLHGATLGIVGKGGLGSAVARLAEGFGMQVRFADRKGEPVAREGYTSFDEVLTTCDVLSLHCPLTPQTRGLIGRDELRRMQRHALLINTARGGLVDEQALVEALREGWIGGAGFDVLSAEPPRAGNPLLDVKLPNLIVTPHVAWASAEAMQTMADQLIDNIEAFMRGEPRNRVV